MPASFPYPRDAADALFDELTSRDQQVSDPRLARSVVLAQPLLAGLLEASLSASLLAEEGRPTHFHLGLLSRGEAAAFEPVIFRFRIPLPLNPDTIRKASPAFHPDETLLLVDVDQEQGRRLVLWGALTVGSRRRRPDESVQVFEGFNLRSVRPGRLDGFAGSAPVYRHDPIDGSRVLSLGELDQDRLVHAIALLLPSVREASQEALPAGGRQVSDPARDGAASVLLRIAQVVQKGLRGGLICVVPTGQQPACVEAHPSFTPASPSAVLRTPFERSLRHPGAGVPESRSEEGRLTLDFAALERHDELRHAEQVVAHLTHVDGAVLMDASLQVLGFGAKVKPPNDAKPLPVREIRLSDAAVFHPYDGFEMTGTRHAAGRAFCECQPNEALALVASQDGRLMLIARTKVGPAWAICVIDPLEISRHTAAEEEDTVVHRRA